MTTRRPALPRLSACLIVLACLFAAGCQDAPEQAKPAAGFAGTYKGRGASEEVRFNRPGVLTLTVKHETEFSLKIAPDGQVTGEGHITYNMTPNTQGLDSIVASVRGAMSMTPGAIGSAMSAVNTASDVAGKAAEAGDAAGVKSSGKRPGGLSYTATHLKNGPEVRHFRIKGRIDRTAIAGGEELRLVLEVDGDYKRPDGTADPKLIAQWEVNGLKEEKPFPCWSPFLKTGYAVLRKGEGGVWAAEFSEKGTHRNNDKNWQEYGYYWLIQQSN